MKKNNKGFSLAELIVVVLILGILAVAITPQIMNWIDKSKVGKDQNYAGTVATAVESVALEWIGTNNPGTIPGTITITGTGVTGAASGNFQQACQDMIGLTKCRAPEQNGKSSFLVTITQNGKTVDVSCSAY